jgi:hypothetical protein
VAWHSPEYRKYLKSPEWAERKRRYYAIHYRRCAARGRYKKIHLHQRSYERLTREPDSDPRPLCFNCHRNVHRANETGRFRDLEAATIFIVKRVQARLTGSTTRASASSLNTSSSPHPRRLHTRLRLQRLQKGQEVRKGRNVKLGPFAVLRLKVPG